MADKEANLSSDESDEDYIPDAGNTNASEEEDSGDAESEEETSEPKRKKNKPLKSDDTEDNTKKTEKNLDIDALWADFKKDADAPKPATTTKSAEVAPPPNIEVPQTSTAKRPPPMKLAGAPKSSGGLSSVLAQLGKKNKVSVLEKSKLDWNNFKRAEGIEDEISTHNRGKDGFLEKRDFLERTDMRQFEIEKQLRAIKRSNR